MCFYCMKSFDSTQTHNSSLYKKKSWEIFMLIYHLLELCMLRLIGLSCVGGFAINLKLNFNW